MSGMLEKLFGTKQIAKPGAEEVKQVAGRIERCGFFFQDEYWFGQRMLLESDNTLYLLAGTAFKKVRGTELMQPGDEVSFSVNERNQVVEGTFVNKTLHARLNPTSAK